MMDRASVNDEEETSTTDGRVVLDKFGLVDLLPEFASTVSQNEIQKSLNKPIEMVVSHKSHQYFILSLSDKKLLYGTISDLNQTLFDQSYQMNSDDTSSQRANSLISERGALLCSNPDKPCHVLDVTPNAGFVHDAHLLSLKMSPNECYIGILNQKQLLCYQISTLFNKSHGARTECTWKIDAPGGVKFVQFSWTQSYLFILYELNACAAEQKEQEDASGASQEDAPLRGVLAYAVGLQACHHLRLGSQNALNSASKASEMEANVKDEFGTINPIQIKDFKVPFDDLCITSVCTLSDGVTGTMTWESVLNRFGSNLNPNDVLIIGSLSGGIGYFSMCALDYGDDDVMTYEVDQLHYHNLGDVRDGRDKVILGAAPGVIAMQPFFVSHPHNYNVPQDVIHPNDAGSLSTLELFVFYATPAGPEASNEKEDNSDASVESDILTSPVEAGFVLLNFDDVVSFGLAEHDGSNTATKHVLKKFQKQPFITFHYEHTKQNIWKQRYESVGTLLQPKAWNDSAVMVQYVPFSDLLLVASRQTNDSLLVVPKGDFEKFAETPRERSKKFKKWLRAQKSIVSEESYDALEAMLGATDAVKRLQTKKYPMYCRDAEALVHLQMEAFFGNVSDLQLNVCNKLKNVHNDAKDAASDLIWILTTHCKVLWYNIDSQTLPSLPSLPSQEKALRNPAASVTSAPHELSKLQKNVTELYNNLSQVQKQFEDIKMQRRRGNAVVVSFCERQRNLIDRIDAKVYECNKLIFELKTSLSDETAYANSLNCGRNEVVSTSTRPGRAHALRHPALRKRPSLLFGNSPIIRPHRPPPIASEDPNLSQPDRGIVCARHIPNYRKISNVANTPHVGSFQTPPTRRGRVATTFSYASPRYGMMGRRDSLTSRSNRFFSNKKMSGRVYNLRISDVLDFKPKLLFAPHLAQTQEEREHIKRLQDSVLTVGEMREQMRQRAKKRLKHNCNQQRLNTIADVKQLIEHQTRAPVKTIFDTIARVDRRRHAATPILAEEVVKAGNTAKDAKNAKYLTSKASKSSSLKKTKRREECFPTHLSAAVSGVSGRFGTHDTGLKGLTALDALEADGTAGSRREERFGVAASVGVGGSALITQKTVKDEKDSANALLTVRVDSYGHSRLFRPRRPNSHQKENNKLGRKVDKWDDDEW